MQSILLFSFLSTSEVDLSVVTDDSIVQLTLSKPRGFITGVKHHGVGNLLEVKNREDGRGYANIYLQLICFLIPQTHIDLITHWRCRYWDVVWNRSDPDSGIFDM